MNDIKKIFRSVKFGAKGLQHAYHGDKSFRMETYYGLPIYLVIAFILAPFQPWELVLYTFSYVLILMVELINTAFEKMLERVHPDEHEIIGKSKDISAAAVLLAFIFALIVIFILAYTRFSHIVQFMTGSSYV